MLTPEIIEARRKIIEARRKLVAKNERELSKQPPRPLQPGDKVLVECYYEASHAPGRGRVRFHAPVYQGHRMVSGDIVMGVPLSAIRPFPQEEV